MGLLLTVVLYSSVIVLAALVGGLIALSAARRRIVILLAFAAGVMFGAAFFHMLPEALHQGGYPTFFIAALGFVFLFILERYVLVHVCEEPPDCQEHSHHSMGLTAFIGLAIHTIFDGIALGSATEQGVGFAALIAITMHKLPSSVSLASILRSEGRRKSSVLVFTAVMGGMVPLGAGLYFALDSWSRLNGLAAKALAFSAGTFLYISVSDLLPYVNRHGKQGRLKSLAGLLAGLLLMLGLTFLTSHQH